SIPVRSFPRSAETPFPPLDHRCGRSSQSSVLRLPHRERRLARRDPAATARKPAPSCRQPRVSPIDRTTARFATNRPDQCSMGQTFVVYAVPVFQTAISSSQKGKVSGGKCQGRERRSYMLLYSYRVTRVT